MEDKHTGSLGVIFKQTVVTRERDNQTAQQTTSPLPVSPKPEHSAVTLTPAADYRMVYQDNALTQSRRSLDLIEQRCLYQIIWKVRQDYVEKGDVQRDLWDNMRITLTSKQLGEVTDSTFQFWRHLAIVVRLHLCAYLVNVCSCFHLLVEFNLKL